MCGICGMVLADGRALDPGLLDRMTDRLFHRGPDDRGTYVSQPSSGRGGPEHPVVGLGMRRLSIIDLSGGHQPMVEATPRGEVALAFNGEIYNFQELRAELEREGASFRTRSDTEVLLKSYLGRAEASLDGLRGMFAFALWDEGEGRLWLARDRFGKKPLYYASDPDGGWLAFASEIKSLLLFPEVRAQVNPEALYHYLTFQYVPDPITLFAGIRKLPPAHHLSWRAGRTGVRAPGLEQPLRYWDHLWAAREQDPVEAAAAVRTTLAESVRLRMIADVPVGAFLSGGLDSSAIVALMSQATGPGMLNTFSVAPDPEEPGAPASAASGAASGLFAHASDERQHARRVAERFQTVHHEVVVGAQRYADALPMLSWHQDEPVADPSALLLYFVARLAREHVTVVLSGEGADELFGGYLIYGEPAGTAPFRSLPAPARAVMMAAARRLPRGTRGANYVLRAGTPLRERYFGNASIFWGEAKAELWKGAAPWDSAEFTDPWWKASADQDLTTQMQTVDVHTWLPGDILMKADKMTMANSLELRVPFLDHQLAAVAATLPTNLRINQGTTKWLLRKAVADLLPETNAARSKLGFPVPLASWLRGPLAFWADELLADECLDEHLQRTTIDRLWEEHRAGRADRARRLWVLICYVVWHRVFIQDRQPQPVAPAAALVGAGRD